MTIKAVLIDDEQGARESLANIILNYFEEIDVVAKADSAQTGYDAIVATNPNLVFLDIEMPKDSAFDLLEKFKTIDFDIIFVTAYDHYAIKAIKYSAVDYLLKPVDIDELGEAIKKHKLNKARNVSNNDRFKVLLNNVKNENKSKKLAVPDTEGLNFVDIKDIIRCESDGNYTNIILMDGKKMLSSKTLGEYENMLSDNGFFRIHRSNLINITHIKKYIRGEGGSVIMVDGSEVEVSRRKKTEFIDYISGS